MNILINILKELEDVGNMDVFTWKDEDFMARQDNIDDAMFEIPNFQHGQLLPSLFEEDEEMICRKWNRKGIME